MNEAPRSRERARLAAASKARSRSLSSGGRTDRRSTLTWWRRTAFSSWSCDSLPRPVSTPTRRTSMKQMDDPKARGCYLPPSIRAENWDLEPHRVPPSVQYMLSAAEPNASAAAAYAGHALFSELELGVRISTLGAPGSSPEEPPDASSRSSWPAMSAHGGISGGRLYRERMANAAITNAPMSHQMPNAIERPSATSLPTRRSSRVRPANEWKGQQATRTAGATSRPAGQAYAPRSQGATPLRSSRICPGADGFISQRNGDRQSSGRGS
jgi:hypothetical protein